MLDKGVKRFIGKKVIIIRENVRKNVSLVKKKKFLSSTPVDFFFQFDITEEKDNRNQNSNRYENVTTFEAKRENVRLDDCTFRAQHLPNYK